jgi:hypothetical protein
MIPDLASVMRKRYRMERNLRLVAALLLIASSLLLVRSVTLTFTAMRHGGWWLDVLIGELLSLLPFLVCGMSLAFGARLITRWILPIPRAGCPRCGYRLVALVEPRCPECGLGLPRELMHGTDPD